MSHDNTTKQLQDSPVRKGSAKPRSTDLAGQQSLFADIEINTTTTEDRPDWESEWTTVRIRKDLAEDLQQLLGEIVDGYAKTGDVRRLPSSPHVDVDSPALWWSIQKSLDDYRAHKARSRRK